MSRAAIPLILDVNAASRYAPPVHGGEFSGTFTLAGSFGQLLHGWKCVCGVAYRSDSAETAEREYADHIAAVSK